MHDKSALKLKMINHHTHAQIWHTHSHTHWTLIIINFKNYSTIRVCARVCRNHLCHNQNKKKLTWQVDNYLARCRHHTNILWKKYYERKISNIIMNSSNSTSHNGNENPKFDRNSSCLYFLCDNPRLLKIIECAIRMKTKTCKTIEILYDDVVVTNNI